MHCTSTAIDTFLSHHKIDLKLRENAQHRVINIYAYI